MKINTLKELIKLIEIKSGADEKIIDKVINLIELFESDDTKNQFVAPGWVEPYRTPPYNTCTDFIPYSEKCACNPKNGGSGICNCTLGANQITYSTTKS